MKTISLQHPARLRSFRSAFSVVEVLVTTVLIALVGALALETFSGTRSAVVVAKLSSDVQKLNQAVAVYLGEGGDFSGLTTPQAILYKLKTTRAAADARRNVGVMTGRAIDVRLSVEMQSASEASSTDPRVLWDGAGNKFVISMASGTPGVARFIIDDTLADNSIPADSRAQSKVMFNGADGWVWGSVGGSQGAAPIAPYDATLADAGSVDSAYTTSGAAAVSSPPSGLPAPAITPPGGSFPSSTFPASVTVNSNGAPGGSSSAMQYQITHANGTSTAWTAYSSPVAIAYGDTVKAKNVSLNTSLYTDSSATTQTYVLTSPTTLPIPVITPAGGSYAAWGFPASVTVSPNGAPGGSSSSLKYMITHSGGSTTPWAVYSAPVAIVYGDTVTAYNSATDTALYANSAMNSQTYALAASGAYAGTSTSPTGLTTNWNKTGAGNILWMNSNVKVSGTHTEGQTIFFSGVTVWFPFNGVLTTVNMPNAQITFTSSVSSASSVYDAGSKTWITTVPLATSGNIFLTGFGWQVPSPGFSSNISGNQVGMNGTFSSNMSTFSLSWQWQTAAYLDSGTNLNNMTVDPNGVGVQVLDGTYLAGTPVNNINPKPVSGGSGGGSSNYTGGHSGTASVSH